MSVQGVVTAVKPFVVPVISMLLVVTPELLVGTEKLLNVWSVSQQPLPVPVPYEPKVWIVPHEPLVAIATPENPQLSATSKPTRPM